MERFPQSGDFMTFVEMFLSKNEACLFGGEVTSGWKARQLWQREGKPDLEYLRKEFGDAMVSVADCNQVSFSSHPKQDMRLHDYLDYWQQTITSATPPSSLLYLKDWHFVRAFPHYGAYTVPDYFTSDWLNEVWDTRKDVEDDYRFVYMGPAGTWTPFHADVFRSYSWSANICGRKEWLLMRPGDEACLKDSMGNLPFDLTSPELRNSSIYPNALKCWAPIRVIQEEGEVMFIPSGWYHQVRNLDHTISINHNWTNSFGICRMWEHIQNELNLVKTSISDCIGMDGWEGHCQLMLKACAGINYCEFVQFLSVVGLGRCSDLRSVLDCWLSCHKLQAVESCQTPDSTLHPQGCSHNTLCRLRCSGATLNSLRCLVLQLENFICDTTIATPPTISADVANLPCETTGSLKPSDGLQDVLKRAEREMRDRDEKDGGGGQGSYGCPPCLHSALALMINSLPSDLEKLLVNCLCLRPCAQCQLVVYRVFEINIVCSLLGECS